MKNRFLKIIISVLLAVTVMATSVFALSCKGKNDPGSSATDTGGVTPEPPVAPVDPDTPEDRSAYTLETFTKKAYDVRAKDLLYVDGTDSSKIDGLDGFVLGDLYNEVFDKLLTTAMDSLANSGLPFTITTDILNARLFRGVDGNWYRIMYREKTNARVNSCLNAILNYKLDGSEKLNINYSLYGSKSLAYILFDYTDAVKGDTSDPNLMLGMALAVSPLLNGVFKTTLNEYRTLLKSTDNDARVKIVLKNFGTVKLREFASMFLYSDIKKNRFVETTLDLTVKQAYDVLAASTDAEKYEQLANIYTGISIANVFNVAETDKFYISAIHSMTLEGLFTAMQNGKDATTEYLLGKTGQLTVGEVVKACIALSFNNIQDEGEKVDKIEAVYSAYDVIYNKFKLLFDLTVNDIYGAVKGLPEYDDVKNTVIFGSFTVDSLINMVKSGFVYDETSNQLKGYDLKKVADFLLPNYESDLDTIVLYDTVTLKTLVVTMKNSFVLNAETGINEFSLNAFFASLEKEFSKAELDAAANALMIQDYETLKGLVNSGVDYLKDLLDTIMSNITPSEPLDFYGFAVKTLNYLIGLNEEDTAIYTFTDSKGNVFDLTANEFLKILRELLKREQGVEYDLKGELANLLGDAKIGTFIEMINSLQISSPQNGQAAA